MTTFTTIPDSSLAQDKPFTQSVARALRDNTLAIAEGDGTAPLVRHPGSAKAWVNFNGTGTVAIRDSFGVSSITDLGTGRTQVNFTNAMSNASYAVTGVAGIDTSGAIGSIFLALDRASDAINANYCKVRTGSTGSESDCVNVCVAVFGRLA